MSLDNIKDITTEARNNLVNAIRKKGVSIAEDSTINQCANAITLITDGGSVGGMKFYKCASVDTANKTWSGYELILQDGVYSISDEVTDGLQYSSVTPIVGNVYSHDALIIVKYANGLISEEGLLLYVPLSASSDTAETGQSLSYSGELTYEVHEGIPCAYFNGNSYFGVNGLTNDGDLTESVWIKMKEGVSFSYMIAWYQDVSGGRYSLVGSSNRYYAPCDGNSSYEVNAPDIDFYKWHHICVVKSGNDWSVYADGKLTETKNLDWNPSSGSTRYYGQAVWTGFNRVNWHGWMAGIRTYKRALSQEEITVLSKEFKIQIDEMPPELVGTPRGTRLMLRHIDLDPVWEEEFVQDDPTATGYDRTWTNVNPQGYDRIMYNPDYGGWNVFSNYGDPLYAGADREDPWGTDGFDGLAEIVVIE